MFEDDSYVVKPKARKDLERMVEEMMLLEGMSRARAEMYVTRVIASVVGTKKKPTIRTPTRPVPVAIVAQIEPIKAQYRELYQAKYGEEPQISGQEIINAQKLLATYGAELVTRRLNAFFRWEDPWIAQIGYTLGVFTKQWNRLATNQANERRTQQRAAAPRDCRHEPLCRDAREHTQRFLNDARSATS